jgi:hypothetical protein
MMSNKISPPLRPAATDLFGDNSVTLDEVNAWCDAVAPHVCDTPSRRAHYVKWYNVVEKIKRAKFEGNLEAILSRQGDRFY